MHSLQVLAGGAALFVGARAQGGEYGYVAEYPAPTGSLEPSGYENPSSIDVESPLITAKPEYLPTPSAIDYETITKCNPWHGRNCRVGNVYEWQPKNDYYEYYTTWTSTIEACHPRDRECKVGVLTTCTETLTKTVYEQEETTIVVTKAPETVVITNPPQTITVFEGNRTVVKTEPGSVETIIQSGENIIETIVKPGITEVITQTEPGVTDVVTVSEPGETQTIVKSGTTEIVYVTEPIVTETVEKEGATETVVKTMPPVTVTGEAPPPTTETVTPPPAETSIIVSGAGKTWDQAAMPAVAALGVIAVGMALAL